MSIPEKEIMVPPQVMTSNNSTAAGAVFNTAAPMNIATISAGFEKGDFLVREEQGNRVYFDFFEEVREKHIDDSLLKHWRKGVKAVTIGRPAGSLMYELLLNHRKLKSLQWWNSCVSLRNESPDR
jgi:hypothetical protein